MRSHFIEDQHFQLTEMQRVLVIQNRANDPASPPARQRLLHRHHLRIDLHTTEHDHRFSGKIFTIGGDAVGDPASSLGCALVPARTEVSSGQIATG